MNKLNILILTLIISLNSLAQNEPWERISPTPTESSLNDIIRIPSSDRIIAVGSGAAIIWSDDYGINWNSIYKPAGISRFVGFTSVQFVSSNIGYIAGSRSTMLKTVDGGTSWDIIPIPGNSTISDLYFHTENKGVILRSGKVFRTLDGCQTWDSIPLQGSNIDFVNDTMGFIWRKNDPYYFYTVDAGNTWDTNFISTDIENFKLTDIEFIDENNGYMGGLVYGSSSSDYYILKTDNGGVTWDSSYSHYWNTVKDIFALNSDLIISVGMRIMYDNMIVRTNDSGQNWDEAEMCYTYWELNKILILANGKGFSVGKTGQIIVSNDFGETWEVGYETVHRTNFSVSEVVTDSVAFIAGINIANGGVTNGSLLKTNDQGKTWYKLFNHIVNSIHFLNDSVGYYCGIDIPARVYKTIDQGKTWSSYDLSDWTFRSHTVYFINDSIGFVGGEGDDSGIYKTLDGGTNWTLLTNGMVPNEVIGFEFIDDSTGYAIAYWGPLFITYDQGLTWDIESNIGNYPFSRIKFLNEDVGFAIGNLIFKTINGGVDWYEVPSGLEGYPWFNDIDFPTESIGYITLEERENTIIKTNDQGETWFPLEYPCTSTAYSVGFFNEDEGIVMGSNGTIFKTYTGGTVNIPDNESYDIEIFNSVFPNPASSILYIKNYITDKQMSLEIHNLQGVLVKSLKTIDSKQVDISELKPGLYLISFCNSISGHVSTDKLVISR